jgi:hypothetical protein
VFGDTNPDPVLCSGLAPDLVHVLGQHRTMSNSRNLLPFRDPSPYN